MVKEETATHEQLLCLTVRPHQFAWNNTFSRNRLHCDFEKCVAVKN